MSGTNQRAASQCLTRQKTNRQRQKKGGKRKKCRGKRKMIHVEYADI